MYVIWLAATLTTTDRLDVVLVEYVSVCDFVFCWDH